MNLLTGASFLALAKSIYYFNHFSVFMWTGEKKFKYATGGRVFRIRVDRALLLLTLKTILKIQRANTTA